MPNTAVRFAAAVCCAAVASLSVPAGAAEMHFTADLTGASEVPAISVPGKGMLSATYDSASKRLSYTATYSGLSGPVIAAHLHGPADASHNAPVMIPVTGSLASPMKGTVTLTDAQAAALTSGRMYFNVHTNAHKPGEIRGQVMRAN